MENNLNAVPSIRKKTFIFWTGLSLILIAVIFSGFYLTGTSFIWQSDGLTQHYLLFHDYLDKLRHVISGEGFSLWDWSIGMGADVIYSYGYYVIGDPFVYLGLLFPRHLTELAYHIIVLVRLWSIGISFLFYARKIDFSEKAGILGATMYTFTHFAMMNVIRHPFFLLPMIWYPLLCLGIEKILRKESPVLFSLAVALSAFSNFYFFYKLTVLIFLYAVVRWWTYYRHHTKETLWHTVWRGIYPYVIGVMIAGSLFIPMVGSFLGSSRGPGENVLNPFVYPLYYYPSLVQHFLTPGSLLWTVGGFSVFTLFALPFVWKSKDKLKFVPVILTVLGMGVLFPFFGSFMNGFSGPYNRYTFVIPFYLSIASGWFLDHRSRWTDKQSRISFYLLMFFTVFLVGSAVLKDDVQIILLLPLLIGWVMWRMLQQEQKKTAHFLILLVALNMAANSMAYYYPPGKNTMGSRVPYGTAEESYASLYQGMEKELPEREPEPYRVGSTSGDHHVRNQFIYLDLMGLNSYLSVTNGALTDFSEDLETSQFQLIQPLRRGFDDRRLANHQLGVRYILTDAVNEPLLPISYEVTDRTGGAEGVILAETEAAFPLAYTVNTWLPYESFERLNPVEKEAFLVQGATSETKVAHEAVERFEGELPVENQAFHLVKEDGAEAENPSKLNVSDPDQHFSIQIEDPASLQGNDVYVHLKGIEYTPPESPFWKMPEYNYTAYVKLNENEKSVYQSSPLSFSSYFERNAILVNMGYLPQGEHVDEFTLRFDLPGTYRFEDIQIYALEADRQQDIDWAEEKRDNQMHFTAFEQDDVEGWVDQEEGGVLVTSIPYTEGWTVEVDGEAIETFVVNSGFLGAEIPEGRVNISMVYRTPYLTLGLFSTVMGMLLLFIEQRMWHRNSRRFPYEK